MYINDEEDSSYLQLIIYDKYLFVDMSIPIRRFFSDFEKRMLYSLYLVARDLYRTENTLDKRCCGYSANCFSERQNQLRYE